MLYKDLIYMISDEVKLNSDDSFFTELHIKFLIDKTRALILKQRYSDVKKEIPQSNYQTICLDLEETNAIDGEACTGGTYLRSIQEIPNVLPIGNNQVYPIDYYQGEITFVPKEKMRYVGYNKYLKNIIYASIAPNNHLYFKSNNPQHKYLEKVRFTGIFEDSDKASELSCDGNEANCDYLEKTVALEESLVPILIEMVVKELLGVKYQPRDIVNDAAPLNVNTNADNTNNNGTARQQRQ